MCILELPREGALRGLVNLNMLLVLVCLDQGEGGKSGAESK